MLISVRQGRQHDGKGPCELTGGTRSRSLQHEAARLMRWLECHLYNLISEYIQGLEADWLPRLTLDLNERSLKSSVFNQLADRFSLPILDLIASKSNVKVLWFFPRNLCPEAEGIGCFPTNLARGLILCISSHTSSALILLHSEENGSSFVLLCFGSDSHGFQIW